MCLASLYYALICRSRSAASFFSVSSACSLPGAVTENELPLPRPGKSVPCTQSAQFTVPYSYLDLNGHMNNTRYFDLAQDLLPPEAQGQTPKRIIVEYASEATLGQTLNVGLGAGENGWYLEGVCDRRVFRMWID